MNIAMILSMSSFFINANPENIGNISIGSFHVKDIQNEYEIGIPIVVGTNNGQNIWEVPVFSQGKRVGELNVSYGKIESGDTTSLKFFNEDFNSLNNINPSPSIGTNYNLSNGTSGINILPDTSSEVSEVPGTNDSISFKNSVIVTESVSAVSKEWYDKGIEYISQDNYKEALKSFQKALDIYPMNILALDRVGTTLFALGKDKEAMSAFDKALGIDSNYTDVLKNKENSKLSQHWYDEGTKNPWKLQ